MIKAEWTSNDALSAEQTTQTNAPNALNVMDCVSRKAAVSRISDLLILELKGQRLPTWNEVYKAISELPPAQPEPRWIPVTERLPEKYGWYLCSGKDERVMMRFWNNHRWWDNIRKSMFELYDIYGKLTGEKVTDFQEQINWTDWVTAWMPLPESYRKETEDEET